MKHLPVSVAILSGKGGVGKSNLALNIACGLFQSGQNALLVDCDMGLANMDVLLGIHPHMHMQDMLMHDRKPEDILIALHQEEGAPRLDLLPANSGMAEFADLDHTTLNELREIINPLARRYDFTLLDIGAGISPTVLEFAAMATLRVMVVTPEPTSLTDSYAVMKVLSTRHGITDFFVAVNQAESHAEGERTFARLASVCERFLGFSPTLLGTVRSDRAIPEAVRRQTPLLQMAPQSPAATDLLGLAAALLQYRNRLAPSGETDQPLRDLYAMR